MTNPEIKYSIVIPFYGDETYLHILLESIYCQLNFAIEVIIVTNKKLEIVHENVTIETTNRILTYPQAVNAGANIAKSDFLIFCDADCYLMPGSLEKLISFYHSSHKIGIASSKLVCPYTGKILEFGIGFNHYNSPHIGKDRDCTFPLFKENRRVQAACSANMIIEKKIFIELNGFDEALSYSYCDLDLCLRVKCLGKETWVVADSIVFHRGNSSNPNSSIFKNDVKGRFWALNVHRIDIDMNLYFKENYTFFQHENKYTFKSYLLVDLSTVVDSEWHYTLFTSELNLRVTDVHKCTVRERDMEHIPLYGLLTWNIIKLRYPIIYFVDRFISLVDNELWWHLRNAEDDLVIDRNGNIDTIINILRK